MCSRIAGLAVPTSTTWAVIAPPGMSDGARGMADVRTTSFEPAPNAGSARSFTSQDSGIQNFPSARWLIGCTLTSLIPAFRNSSAAQLVALIDDGYPETRPQI